MTREHDLTLPGPPETALFAAIPERPRRAMIVIHEIFGRQPEIDRVVQRFAARGWAAAAPNLFKGGLGCVLGAMESMSTGKGAAVEKVAVARKWLAAEARVPEQSFGIIGFCFGGGFALAAGPAFAAVSTNYGEVPRTETLRGIGPVVACYAGRDHVFEKSAKLEARLAPLGTKRDIKLYPSVGHSFLTDGRHPIARVFAWPFMHTEKNDPAVREEAWTRIFSFLEEHVPNGQ